MLVKFHCRSCCSRQERNVFFNATTRLSCSCVSCHDDNHCFCYSGRTTGRIWTGVVQINHTWVDWHDCDNDSVEKRREKVPNWTGASVPWCASWSSMDRRVEPRRSVVCRVAACCFVFRSCCSVLVGVASRCSVLRCEESWLTMALRTAMRCCAPQCGAPCFGTAAPRCLCLCKS